MIIIEFIKDYWTQIVFLVGLFSAFYSQYKASKKATLCSLRNDILEIYDKCKPSKTISCFQMESYIDSRDLYFKLGGDGFIHKLDDIITKEFKVVD